MTYEEFVASDGPRLRAALVAAYGPQVGLDAAADALAYGWEHWQRLGRMANPAGYLYRVGQTAARRSRRPQQFLPAPAPAELPEIEPMLVPALERLTASQRVVVMLVHGFGYPQAEVAELLGVSPSTVNATLRRALAHLQQLMEVDVHDR